MYTLWLGRFSGNLSLLETNRFSDIIHQYRQVTTVPNPYCLCGNGGLCTTFGTLLQVTVLLVLRQVNVHVWTVLMAISARLSGDSRSLPVLTPDFQWPLPVKLSHFRLYWKWCDHSSYNRKWCSQDNSALEKQLAITQGIYGMNWMLATFMWDWRRRLQKRRRAKEITPELPGLKEEKNAWEITLEPPGLYDSVKLRRSNSNCPARMITESDIHSSPPLLSSVLSKYIWKVKFEKICD